MFFTVILPFYQSLCGEKLGNEKLDSYQLPKTYNELRPMLLWSLYCVLDESPRKCDLSPCQVGKISYNSYVSAPADPSPQW